MSRDIEQFNITDSADDHVDLANLVKVQLENGTIRVHDGMGTIRLENLAFQSEDFSTTWTTNNCSVTANQANGPDGSTNTADKIVFNGSADPYLLQEYDTGAALANRTFTVSCWVWTDAGQPTTGQLFIYDQSAGDVGSTNLTITTTPTRYEFTRTFSSSEADTSIRFRIDGPTSTPTNGQYHYVWGYTLQEHNAFCGYYPTTDTQKFAEEFIGVGQIGAVSSIRTSPDLRPVPVNLTLSGIPSSILHEANNGDHYGGAVSVHTVFLDDDAKPLTKPALNWEGFLDQISMEVGDSTGSMTVTGESRFALWDKPNLRRYTDVDQQAVYSGDLFFEYLPQMMELTLEWGGRKTGTGVSSSGGVGMGIFRNSTFGSFKLSASESPSSQDDFPW